MKYYFVGIKGSGMSSLAKILFSLNEDVRGCDYSESFYTEEGLEGIIIDPISQVLYSSSYLYIIGNAFLNHEICKVIKDKYPYLTYPDFIAQYFKNYFFIAISGSHGKTQTTKLFCHLLDNNIGLIGDGSINFCENHPYFVMEACEYQNTFLHYKPNISLILNVDYDHVDYFKEEKDYQNAFERFIKQSKIVLVNKDDSPIDLGHAFTYSKEDFIYKDGVITINNNSFSLPFKGEKFAENFMGIYLILKHLNVSDETIKNRLKTYKGAKRRFEKVNINQQIVILDYAHHPSEIKTMFESIKETYPNKRIIAIFEPHTISRLEKFIEDYKNVLSLFDETYLYPLFTSVREKLDIQLVDKLYKYLGFFAWNEKCKSILKNEDAIILFLGAGQIDQEFNRYIQ